MIGIVNQGRFVKDKTVYHLFINEEFICEFEHKPTNGLAMCLLEASKAVERHKWAQEKELVEKLYAMDGRQTSKKRVQR